MSSRPLAQGHRELMAQHQDLGVLPPRLPPRQAQHRHGPGDDEEDQLQAHKPKIIACQPEPDRPPGTPSRDRADGVPQSICPGGASFRHPQVRTQLLTLGAGVFAAGALVYTTRNFTLSRRTYQLTEQGQVTDRYTRAIEQLGSDKLDVRIGGIYALERIARDSARDHPTVMEVLAAFIREHSREPWPPRQSAVSDLMCGSAASTRWSVLPATPPETIPQSWRSLPRSSASIHANRGRRASPPFPI